MNNGLTIKTAAEYVAAAEIKHAEEVETEVTNFINNVVAPKIEDMIDNPVKYTSSGAASFRVDYYPASKFVAKVASMLTPLGYGVRESHDGGGMYATVVIHWEHKK
jgi:hypothetical protein